MFSYVTVKVNVVTCEYIDFYLTAQYSLLYYSQCSHMCQVKVNVVTCEYIDLKIVPSPSIYMTNCSIVLLLQQFSTMSNIEYLFLFVFQLRKTVLFEVFFNSSLSKKSTTSPLFQRCAFFVIDSSIIIDLCNSNFQ